MSHRPVRPQAMGQNLVRNRARYDSDIKELRYRITEKIGPVLDRAKRLRDQENTGSIHQPEYQHVAGVSMVAALEIKEKYGIDCWNPKRHEFKKLFQIIERDYPKLKTVNKRIA